MRFFDRTEEIAALQEIYKMSQNNAQFTVITGRRRIGKTSLVWKAYENMPLLYFFVARKSESDLCEDYLLEIENYRSLKMIIERDYETFSGLMLERYFKRILIEQQHFTRIDGWWDRKGENEIDIVAENELDDTATFFEVKRKAENIDMDELKAKAAVFLRATGKFKGYDLTYKGLSMSDM